MQSLGMVLRLSGTFLVWKFFPWVIILLFISVDSSMGAEEPAKYPSRPITMIIQWAAGGTTDLSGRKLAELAGKILGQPIVVENKVGGSGVIGINAVAKAAPDGYTIGTITNSAIVIIPHLRSVPYNSKEDFTYLMQYGEYGMIFSVLADSPCKTFKDFIREAQENPGKLKYASPGPSSSPHIFMEYVFRTERVKVNHIPVAGGVEADRQLLGGHLDGAITPDFIPYIKGKKVRGLAAQTEKRLEGALDVPTFVELGYNVELPNWMGVCAPKGLDPLITKKLFDAFKKAYEDPSFQESMGKFYLPTIFRDPESFKAFVLKDFETQGRVLKELGFSK